MMLINEDQMMLKGLVLCGFTHARQNRVCKGANIERFSACFGKTPAVLVLVWNDLQQLPIHDQLINATEQDLEAFLWLFFWLKSYPTEKKLEGCTGWCDKIVRERLKRMLTRIASLKPHKIVWPANWNNPNANTPIFLISVDGTHCPIFEPTKGHQYSKNTRYYSHKFQRSGLAYELALSIFTNHIVWISGPFPAAMHDPDIFVLPNGLRSRMPHGKKAIADSAYRRNAIRHVVSVANNADTREVRVFKRRVRARQETIFGRMKVFGILSTNFRHGEALHKDVFHAVAVTCQYEMEILPLFDP